VKGYVVVILPRAMIGWDLRYWGFCWALGITDSIFISIRIVDLLVELGKFGCLG
jgi:hypothetical protein